MKGTALRPAKASDAEFLFHLTQDKEYRRHYLERLVFGSILDAEQEIRRTQKKRSTAKYFLIVKKVNEQEIKLGMLHLYKINKQDKRCAIGYGVASKHWNKGVATRAIKKSLEVMKRMHLHGCEATVDPNNAASAKVLEKNGFKKVGTIKEYYFENKKFIDRALYWRII